MLPSAEEGAAEGAAEGWIPAEFVPVWSRTSSLRGCARSGSQAMRP